MVRSSLFPALLCTALLLGGVAASAQSPWVITGPVTLTAPADLGDVVVTDGGSLTIAGVPDPGVRFTGNLVVQGTGTALFEDSAIRFMSQYNGQYTLVVQDQGVLTILRCDYRIPSGVQHTIIAAGSGAVGISDTDFGSIQLLCGGEATLEGARLNGSFECVLQDGGTLDLTDIPRDPGGGRIWVWPTFMPGSTAVYSPPLPGFVLSYDFPPAGSSGIGESFHLTRCNVLLWPLLVREGSDLTLRDIAPQNWVVVGLHLPASTSLSGLVNGTTYADETLPLGDRTLRLENASVDTWNLYPGGTAQVDVRDSTIGELLAFGSSSVTLEGTTVDGTGGYFGATESSSLVASDCTFTCDVQITRGANAVLRDCLLLPHPFDPTGALTYLRVYDDAVLHLDRTAVAITPELGGSALIAVTWITDAPSSPPPKSAPALLHGYAALYSGDPANGLKKWVLKSKKAGAPQAVILAKGKANVQGGLLGTWGVKKTSKDYQLILKLKDRQGRVFVSSTPVPP